MKDYIIDLGLEFGLRFRLAAAVTIQPGPKIKRKKMGRAFWSLRATPSFPLTCPDTPPDARSLSSLSLLIFFLLLPPPLAPSSSSNFRPKQPQTPTIRPPLRVSHGWARIWAEFRVNLAYFRQVWATNQGLNEYPRYVHAIHVLVASISYELE